MGANSKIEWTDCTDNIIVVKGGGWWCRKISPGCENCYAAALNRSPYYGGNKLDCAGRYLAGVTGEVRVGLLSAEQLERGVDCLATRPGLKLHLTIVVPGPEPAKMVWGAFAEDKEAQWLGSLNGLTEGRRALMQPDLFQDATAAAGEIDFRLPVISIRQPCAWLIVHGWKNIENRLWPTRVRGPVLIHAGGRA